MAVRNVTQWQAPSGTGYFSGSGGLSITTLSGSTLTTLSGSTLTTDSEVYSPKYNTTWTYTTKNKSNWNPASGAGYVIATGALNLITNLSQYLITNSGNFIVTNDQYVVPKYQTAWTETGA